MDVLKKNGIVRQNIPMTDKARVFVQSLESNSALPRTGLHNVVTENLMNAAVGAMTLATGVVMYLAHRAEARARSERPDEITVQTLDERLSKLRFLHILSSVGTGATTILSAIYTIARYRPTRTEATLAALLRYLKMRGVIEPDFAAVVSRLRPYRIESLKI